MRILHIYKDYHPVLGGIENNLRQLARTQAAWGHEVTVLVTNPQGARTTVGIEEGVRVIRAARLATLASTPLSPALIGQIGRQRPDITHLHFPYPIGEIGQLLCGRGRPTVITYHSDVVRQAGILRLYAPVLRQVLARADRILVSSPAYRDSSPYLRPLAARCTVVPIGIEYDRFATPRPDEAARWRARYPGPLLLFVGRLRYYKGLNYLLAAMVEIPATLLIAGDGPEAPALRAQAQALGVAGRVHFLGDVAEADLPGLYQAADVFVLPSSRRSEAYGIALLEAMAAGVAVISTELGTGTSWLNRHGETGLVVPPCDPVTLAAALRELLTDEERRRHLAEAAQTRAAAFDLKHQVAQVLAVYEEVLAARDRQGGTQG
jgi:glycosyltransferase involved in cell wall biosynthesis